MGAKKRFIIIKDLIQAPHLLATKTAATTTVEYFLFTNVCRKTSQTAQQQRKPKTQTQKPKDKEDTKDYETKRIAQWMEEEEEEEEEGKRKLTTQVRRRKTIWEDTLPLRLHSKYCHIRA